MLFSAVTSDCGEIAYSFSIPSTPCHPSSTDSVYVPPTGRSPSPPAGKMRFRTADWLGRYVSKGKNLASDVSLYLKTTAVGLCAVGFIQDRYGSRKTIIWGMIFLTGALFLLFFATSLGMLVAGYVLIGLPLGAFQISSTIFASEVCPIRLRPYLTCWVCMSWGVSSTDSSHKSRPCLTRHSLS
jgi:MFS family permease